MKPRKTGDYIDIYWDDCGPHPHYVKGHVTLADAAAVVEKQTEVKVVKMAHKYARCINIGPDHEECLDGLTSTFRVIDTPRKSYYPVTECWPSPQGDET